MRSSNREPTGWSDVSRVAHDNVKHVLDCHTAVHEVVRSSDSRLRIGNQARGGGAFVGAEGHISRGYVVLFASGNGDVEGLRSSQNKTHECVNVYVRFGAPRLRAVQNLE